MLFELLTVLVGHFRLKVFLPTDHGMLIGVSRIGEPEKLDTEEIAGIFHSTTAFFLDGTQLGGKSRW